MSFTILNIREILDFLIGDYIIPDEEFKIGSDSTVDIFSSSICAITPTISLPYLSGNQIKELYPRFNLEYPEYKDGTPSRWCMMKNFITRLDKIGRVNELLAFLFSKHRFQQELNKFKTIEDFEQHYKKILDMGIEYINKQLYISQKKIQIINGNFVITNRNDNSLSIEVNQISKINSDYVKLLPERIKLDLANRDFDSVINKCRTLIEEVLCFIIEQKHEVPVDSGNIEQLHAQCKKLLKMNCDSSQDQRIKQLLSGLKSIIVPISSLRNIGSDAHGVGSKRINIGEREAILISNATQTYCEYYLSVFNNPNR